MKQHTPDRRQFPSVSRRKGHGGPADDETLIDLFFQRSEAAIAETKAKYGALCRGIAYRILGCWEDAEECEDDVYLRIWNAVPPDRPGSLKAYAARIARNLAIDRYQYRSAACRSSALTCSFEELEPWLPQVGADPEQTAEGAVLRKALNDFLRRQPEEARVFFLRRYWYGESVGEIADACHATEGKVKASLFRTRERLRKELTKEGL